MHRLFGAHNQVFSGVQIQHQASGIKITYQNKHFCITGFRSIFPFILSDYANVNDSDEITPVLFKDKPFSCDFRRKNARRFPF